MRRHVSAGSSPEESESERRSSLNWLASTGDRPALTKSSTPNSVILFGAMYMSSTNSFQVLNCNSKLEWCK